MYSKQRRVGSASRYQIRLPDLFVECDPSTERFRVSLMEFSVPYVWYTVNAGFNAILFENLATNTSTSVVVPPGTYAYHDLVKIINGLYPGTKARYLDAQNAVSFSAASQHRVTMSQGIAEILGFEPNVPYEGVAIKSIKPCSPMATTHIILNVTNLPPLDSNVNLTNLSGAITPSSMLAVVPITATPPFHEIVWQNDLDFGMWTSDYKLTSLDFELVNEDGNELTFIPDHRFTLRLDVFDIGDNDPLHRDVADIRNDVRNLFLHKYLRQ